MDNLAASRPAGQDDFTDCPLPPEAPPGNLPPPLEVRQSVDPEVDAHLVERRRIRDMHGLSLKHAAEAFRLKTEIGRRELCGVNAGKLK